MTTRKGGGQPGNKNAAKAKDYERALRAELHFYEDLPRGIEKGKALNRIAKRHVEDCLSDDFEVRHAAREALANRIDGKPREKIDATFTHAVAEELTDDELLDIARGGGDGAAEAPAREADDSSVH